MKNKKYIFAGVGVIVALAIVGGYFFPVSSKVTQFITGAVGDTNRTPRMISVSLDLSTTTPTSPVALATSTMYNGDGRDRIISSIEFYVTDIGSSTSNGAGISSWIWKIGTSTDIYTVSNNLMLNATVATSSQYIYTASTTPGVSGTTGNDFARVWKAGTYLNLFINGTSTGAVTGLPVNQTSETGLLIVNYRTTP